MTRSRKLLIGLHSQSIKGHNGFLLPLVVIIGLLLFAGVMATSTRSFSALIGSIRLGHSRQAREAAESGMAKIIELLNRKYSYLLILPTKADWENPTYPAAICPESDAPGSIDLTTSPLVTGNLFNNNARYTLQSFAFDGNPFYGGVATLEVKGEKLDEKGVTQAVAYLKQSIDVTAKPCGCPPNVITGDCMTSGFPGLLAKNLNLGNNDVAGGVSGNILCIDCTSMYDYAMPEDKEQAIKEEINCTSNCNVAGNIYGGPIAMPPVLKFPSSLLNLITFSDITNSTTITWSASSSSNNGRCATDGNGVMHCLVRNIKLNNNTLTFFAPTSPYERRIRVYITGGVELKGQATINTYSTSGGPSQPWQLSLFGLEDNNPSIDCATDDGTNSLLTGSTALASGNQKIELSGKNQINAFIYFPKGCFNFNGGQLSKPEVYGAVWVKGYIQNGGGGNGAQYANIEVPPNMGSKLHEQTNLAYGLSIKDYAARGVKSWQLFQAN